MDVVGGLIIIIGLIYGVLGGTLAAVVIWLCCNKINTFSRVIALWFGCMAVVFLMTIIFAL